MCWSEGASLTMVGVGAVATLVTMRRGDPPAIPATLAFFSVMEALQVAGYWVIDDCGLPSNQAVTAMSYIHIALQPLFINAFAMAIAPRPVSVRMRRAVYGLAGLATLLVLARMIPFDWAGQCQPGDVLCGPAYCTISGTWHLGWMLPLNNMWGLVSPLIPEYTPFPAYLLAVFGLPLLYGAWRFVIFHAALGPILAMTLTDNPNEMPAIWCLLSVGLALLALSPLVRGRVMGTERAAP